MSSNRTILITGTSGFIGSKFKKHLEMSGLKTLSPSKEELNLLSAADVHSYITKHRPEVIYHFAAFNDNSLSYKEPHSCIDSNTRMTLNILESVRLNNRGKVILPSTYYLKIEDLGSPYVFSKYLQEKIARHYQETFRVPVAIIRLANIYGRNTRHNTLLQEVAEKMIRGDLVIKTGNLNLFRDFLYIDDACEALKLLGEKPKFPVTILELGSGHAVRLKDVVKELAKVLSYEGKIEDNSIEFKGNTVHQLVTAPSVLNEILNWSPRISLSDGLTQMTNDIKLSNNHD